MRKIAFSLMAASFLGAVLMLVIAVPARADGPGQSWIYPVQCSRTNVPFGEPNPAGRQPRHTGVDFGCPVGTPVRAVAEGEVVWARWWPPGSEPAGHGQTLWIYHGVGSDGRPIYSVYAHLSEFKVSEGDQVQQGQVIALTGDTGFGTGPHLHFAVGRKDPSEGEWRFADWDNPDLYLGRRPQVSQLSPNLFQEIKREIQQKIKRRIQTWIVHRLARMIPVVVVFVILLDYVRTKRALRRRSSPRSRPTRRFEGWFLGLGVALLVWGVVQGDSLGLEVGAISIGVAAFFLLGRVWGEVRPFWPGWRKPFLPRWLREGAIVFGSLLLAAYLWGMAIALWSQTEGRAIVLWSQTEAPEWVPVNLTWWNGDTFVLDVPQEVWQDIWDAGHQTGADPVYLVCLGSSESTRFWETGNRCSKAGACGPYQFLPGTWARYQPWPGASRTSWPDAIYGAGGMVVDLRLDSQPNKLAHRRRFTGADGGQCWNRHAGQADYVWACVQAVTAALEQ